MVVYWSIKSAIDLAGYGLGMSDSFQGTGVYSGIKMSRENKEPEEVTPAKAAEPKKEPVKQSK